MTQIIQQTSGGFFSSLLTFLKWSIQKWYLIVGIFVLLSVIIVGINDSVKERNFGPLVYNLGGSVVSPDSVIFYEVQRLKENPQITIEGDREYNSYWEKIKFKFGKWGSHIRILVSFLFLFGMFYLLYQGLNYLSERKALNMVVVLLIMILLQMSFMLMIMFKDKTGLLPTMNQFLSTYSSILYLAVTMIIIGITFTIFNSFEASQTMQNLFYTLILGLFIFIFIGYLGVVNSLDLGKKTPTNVEIMKNIIPFKGTISLFSNLDIIVGYGILNESVLSKIPKVNESLVSEVIEKSVNI